MHATNEPPRTKHVIILFGLAASTDDKLNGLWLRYQTNMAFDLYVLRPLDLTV